MKDRLEELVGKDVADTIDARIESHACVLLAMLVEEQYRRIGIAMTRDEVMEQIARVGAGIVMAEAAERGMPKEG